MKLQRPFLFFLRCCCMLRHADQQRKSTEDRLPVGKQNLDYYVGPLWPFVYDVVFGYA